MKAQACAVCGISLDIIAGQWAHGRELTGKSDHIAIPVDYDSITVRTMCDFCFAEVPGHGWTVPSESFSMPGIEMGSAGHWCACNPCALLITNNDWNGLTDRAVASYIAKNGGSASEIRPLLASLYRRLRDNMIGSPRAWEPGDEEFGL